MKQIKIANHYSASLSDLDMQMAIQVPPGGNWKDIPDSIPSKRLAGIRESYLAGGGSRSTYYGRLMADAPSYTINTHFSRPGNGCHLHYDFEGGQHRVISQREAARLQSFPDNFRFLGSRSAINTQIGNAVPPLLAYQIATSLPFEQGQFVDLFSGAGGLSLGFTWAGWKPLVANDKVEGFLETYKANIHNNVVAGDIQEAEVFNAIVKQVQQQRDKNLPLFVVGGPPCQGFSTAGNRRSMEDRRNQLFYNYKNMLDVLEPDGFIFENVTGLLNMEGGRVFEQIRVELQSCAKWLGVWKLQAQEYGVPQRRTRVIIVGNAQSKAEITAPSPNTIFGQQHSLLDQVTPSVTAHEALCDLPSLAAGEDGSHKDYLCEPQNVYQLLMRGHLSAAEYVQAIKSAGDKFQNSSKSQPLRT